MRMHTFPRWTCPRWTRLAVLCALVGIGRPSLLHAQDGARSRPFSAASWCEDSGTYCWRGEDKARWFNGVRVIGEVDLGWLIQGGRNRFVNEGFTGLTKVGLEFNVYEGLASIQTVLIAPGSVELDGQSDLVLNRRLASFARPPAAAGQGTAAGAELASQPAAPQADRHVKVDWGFAAGLSFFDGGISTGRGWLFYDRRDILPTLGRPKVTPSESSDSYRYISFQPISSLRAVFKGSRDDGGASSATPTSAAGKP